MPKAVLCVAWGCGEKNGMRPRVTYQIMMCKDSGETDAATEKQRGAIRVLYILRQVMAVGNLRGLRILKKLLDCGVELIFEAAFQRETSCLAVFEQLFVVA